MGRRVGLRPLVAAFVAVTVMLAWFAGGIGENPSVAALAAAPAVSVFPMPGAHAAMPQSQITFRGVPISAIGPVTVAGSKSGTHSGHLAADSDGQGGSFLPDRAFTPGETVTVTTSLNIINANAGAGRWTFTVATPTGEMPSLAWAAQRRTRNDVQFFHSRHDLSPVSITVIKHGATGDGDFFIDPQYGPVQVGPMIVGPNGHLIWFDPTSGGTSASAFHVQTYHGQPVLTWWQGTKDAGVGVIGQDVIFDDTYKEIATVSAANGVRTDAHAFELTPQGTALITADYPITYDATSVHGSKREIVIDSVVQEIDIPTGLVMFEWDAIDHIPFSDSHQPLPSSRRAPFDPFHLNAVDLDWDGNLIISARETWAAYKVNFQTGAVMWTLGGRHSSFRLGPNATFAFQHDVRARSRGDQYITLFDDEGGGFAPNLRTSRALELKLDFNHRTATTISDEGHSPPIDSAYEGNAQQLPNLNTVVGWGQQPYFTEFNRRGQEVFDARMAGDDASFSAYRFQWTAIPWTVPAVAASTRGKSTTVYASWNGATTVAWWRVLSGSGPTALRAIATAGKNGFETKMTIAASRYVAVQAIDSNHHLIKTSVTIRPHS